MQIIYKATHTPSGKPYIGYKADINKLSSYKTSSKVVKAMMTKAPDEWAMEPIVFILPTVDQVAAVRLEQEVIKQYFEDLGGWDGLWNKAFGYGLENAYSPETREAISKGKKKYYANTPGAIEANRKRRKEHYVNNPEAREAASQKTTEQWADPIAKEAQSLRLTKYFTKPGAKEANSMAQKKNYIDNPERAKAIGRRKKEHFAKPGAREAMSQAKLKVVGKLIEVTLDNGMKMTDFGSVLRKKLGAQHINRLAKGTHDRRKDGSLCPITCKDPQYAGRKIVSARYI